MNSLFQRHSCSYLCGAEEVCPVDGDDFLVLSVSVLEPWEGRRRRTLARMCARPGDLQQWVWGLLLQTGRLLKGPATLRTEARVPDYTRWSRCTVFPNTYSYSRESNAIYPESQGITVYVCVYVEPAEAKGIPLPGMELWVAESCPVWALVTELGFSARTSALNCWASSQALSL